MMSSAQVTRLMSCFTASSVCFVQNMKNSLPKRAIFPGLRKTQMKGNWTFVILALQHSIADFI
jgi:hypothetical protein